MVYHSKATATELGLGPKAVLAAAPLSDIKGFIAIPDETGTKLEYVALACEVPPKVVSVVLNKPVLKNTLVGLVMEALNDNFPGEVIGKVSPSNSALILQIPDKVLVTVTLSVALGVKLLFKLKLVNFLSPKVRVQVERLLKRQLVAALDSPALINAVAERRRAAPVRERLKAGFRFKLTKRKFMV